MLFNKLLGRIKLKLKQFAWVHQARNCFLWFFGHNTIRGRWGNRLEIRGGYRNVSITFYGTGNYVKIDEPAYCDGLGICIRGDGNAIHISRNCVIRNVNIWLEDNGNKVEVGEASLLFGAVSINCIEGTKIHIGRRCMFASDTYLRTGDSHSVLDMNGCRINPSKDIFVGEHCWVGQNALILKGVHLPDHTIVGAASVVAKSISEEYVAIAGNPAKIVKREVDWREARI